MHAHEMEHGLLKMEPRHQLKQLVMMVQELTARIMLGLEPRQISYTMHYLVSQGEEGNLKESTFPCSEATGGIRTSDFLIHMQSNATIGHKSDICI